MLSWFMITIGASTFAMVVGTISQLLGQLSTLVQLHLRRGERRG